MSSISLFGLSINTGSTQNIQHSAAQNFSIGETNPFVQLISMMTGSQQAQAAPQDGIYTASSFNHGVVGPNIGDVSTQNAQDSALGFLAQLFSALEILQGIDSRHGKASAEATQQPAPQDVANSAIEAATPTVMSI